MTPSSAAAICVAVLLWTLLVAQPARAADPRDGAIIRLPLVASSSASSQPASPELEAALRASTDRLALDDTVKLVSVRVSGSSAVAVARIGDKLSAEEIILLARYDGSSGWEVATSHDAPVAFNSFIDQMPSDLLDAGDRAFLRRYEPSSGISQDIHAALFSDHSLPWPGGQIAYVMQRDGGGHEAQIDFDILGNAASGQVLASKAGVVVFVKQSSAVGCPSMLCWQQSNLVVVEHGPAEYSWYVHLAPDSVPVRVGDRVGFGSVIGVEGETGFASGVHLHYMASTGHTAWTPPDDPNRAPWALGIQAVNFREASWDALTVGQRYTSQNGSGDGCTAIPLGADQVALYEHADYCGLYTVLAPGDYASPSAFSFYNDRASSIRMGNNAAAVLCQDEGYGGVCETFDRDVPNLTDTVIGNDQVSSLKVASRQELTAPETPLLLSPAAGALVTTTTAALEWKPAVRAVTYQLQIAATLDFAAVAADVLTASTQITLHALPENDYMWRVRAANDGGLWSEWSQPRPFTLDNAPYRHPYPQSPANGAAVAASRLSLTWIDTETIMSHRLQIYAGDQSLSGSVEVGSLVADTIVTATIHTTEPLTDGIYSWRVCRINALEAAVRCSDFRSVEVDTAPPAPPAPASYVDGAEITDHTPTFAWQPVDGAVEYHIQVYWNNAKIASGDNPVEAETLGPLVSYVTADTSYEARRLADGSYGWHVRARDAAGNWSEWSQSRSLTIVTPPSWLTYLPALSAR